MRRLDQITFKQLRALSTVAAEGKISSAADLLHLTGPAVHSQLKTLEDVIGSPLLIRESRDHTAPTPQGLALLRAYAEARASLERAIRTIQALDRGLEGSVVLGCVSTAKYIAPRIVAKLKSDMPGVEVHLKEANREETIAALGRGEHDLCIMGRPPREPLVEAVPLADHPHVIVAASEHPLAGKGPVTAEALLDELFVMREPGSGTRTLASRYLDELGEGREVRMIEMDSNETIKQAVLNGLGIALISAHTVAEELRSGRLAALASPGTPIVRRWFLISLLDRPLTPAAENVRDWIVAHADTLFPALEL